MYDVRRSCTLNPSGAPAAYCVTDGTGLSLRPTRCVRPHCDSDDL